MAVGDTTWTLLWLAQKNLENATTPQTVLEVFNDSNTGEINSSALTEVLIRAEVLTMAKLHEYGPPPYSSGTLAKLGADDFLRSQAVEMATILMYRRAPESVRQTGGDLEKRMKDWQKAQDDILQARARPPTVPNPPANVGGWVVDGAVRAYIDSPDGTKNSGDF